MFRFRTRSVLALLGFVAVTGLAAWAGGRASGPEAARWYATLDRPAFAPPAGVFGPVWTVLYVTIALSAWRVWTRPRGRARTAALTAWGGQLVLNALWPWLFFGLRRIDLAFVDVLLLFAAIAIYISIARRVDRGAAWLLVPYLAWVGFAAVLNAELLRRQA